MSGLVTFYENCLTQLDGKEAISAILRKEKVNEAILFSLLEECETLSIETPQDSLHFYERVLTIIFFIPFSDVQKDTIDSQLRQLLIKGQKEGYWSSFQLQAAFAALAAYLVTGERGELPVKQLEKGAVLFESGGRMADGSVVKPLESVKLALVWIYLGWDTGEEELLNSGLRLAQFCTTFCDSEGKIFQGLWMKESDYRPQLFRASLALLFSVLSHFQLSPKLQALQESVEKTLQEGIDEVDPINLLLAMRFKKLINENKPHSEFSTDLTFPELDISLGFLRYDYGSLSLACSACGVNTGLGSVHKQGIHIASFGPHYNPLADSNCYGIYRTSNGSREGFRDLMLERHEESCQFKGWTRLISPLSSRVSKQNYSYTSPGHQWLFFDITAEKEILNLDIRIDRHLEESPLSFAFFIAADRASVQGGGTLIPGSLERYQGASTPLIFEREGVTLILNPRFEGEMQVIPLAGKRHFWSAEFLIVYPITEKLKIYSWDIQ